MQEKFDIEIENKQEIIHTLNKKIVHQSSNLLQNKETLEIKNKKINSLLKINQNLEQEISDLIQSKIDMKNQYKFDSRSLSEDVCQWIDSQHMQNMSDLEKYSLKTINFKCVLCTNECISN